MSHPHLNGGEPGLVVAVIGPWIASAIAWMSGAGFFHPTTVFSALSLCLGAVAAYPKLKVGAAEMHADIRKRLKGERA